MSGAIVGYIRLSSQEQANNPQTREQQKTRVIRAGAEKIYEDIQKGRGRKRLSYNQLIQDVKDGKIRKIIITRIDRISRSLITLKELVETLNEYGVTLVVLDQNLDLGTAQGKMWLNMLGTLAEWEVDLLSERVQHGKRYQRSQKWANGSCPFGYKVVAHKYVLDTTPFLCLLRDRPDNYLSLSQVEDLTLLPGRTIAEVSRDFIDIFLQVKGARRALKVGFEKYGIGRTHAKFNGTDGVLYWSPRGFTLWLKNPILDGHTAYLKYKTVRGKRIPLPEEEWQLVKNTHADQRLFRDDEAAAVKTSFQANSCSGRGAFQNNLTGADNYRPFAYQTGLVYCQECNSRCTSKGHKNEYLYYGCRHAGVGCNNRKGVRRKSIEESLIEALVEKSRGLNQAETSSDELPMQSAALVRMEEQLAALEQIPSFNPDIEALKEKLRQQIEAEKNPFLSTDKVLDTSVEELIRTGNNLGIWHLLNNDEKVEIYRKLVHKIYIQDGKVSSIIFNQ
ncbi:fdxN element excision recombinase XisF [Trichocoleus sp. FACHB-262]|uniref:fdxN element excision recombinase XisF n=1 Tax=Trichocoleus sp. FACHB-262 TaxID=2692869 RepID=UPI001F5567DF|nr:fdxN element excision recombinase XisF [Trichocoleus sp. FACHB-262]